MTMVEFHDLLEAYGGDPDAWPASRRAAAEQLVAIDPDAMTAWHRARRFDALLAHGMAMSSEVDGENVLAALGSLHLPPQRRSWTAWPTPLLDFDLAPAWPRVAALAAVAALGFVIGLVGLDRRDGSVSTVAAATLADAGLSVVAFEPEPLTGVRP
jgi:hypothetical protein